MSEAQKKKKKKKKKKLRRHNRHGEPESPVSAVLEKNARSAIYIGKERRILRRRERGEDPGTHCMGQQGRNAEKQSLLEGAREDSSYLGVLAECCQ